MAKINNTSTFPIVPAAEVADGDLLIGTDVSDTTNDAAGETKNFKIEDIRGSWKLIEGGNLTTGVATNDFENWADDSVYFAYKVIFTEMSHDSGSTRAINIRYSTDGGATYIFSVGDNVDAGQVAIAEIDIYNSSAASYIRASFTADFLDKGTYTSHLTVPVDGLRVAPNTANINGGTYAIYGLRRP